VRTYLNIYILILYISDQFSSRVNVAITLNIQVQTGTLAARPDIAVITTGDLYPRFIALAAEV
jgi:hypothetical protein